MLRYSAAAFCIAALATSTSGDCPKGNYDCYTCGSAPSWGAGTPGLSCPQPPGGLPLGDDCIKWTPQSSPNCLSITGNCSTRYICCPEDYTGYFTCVVTVGEEYSVSNLCEWWCCSNGVQIDQFWVPCVPTDGNPPGQMLASSASCAP
jgi:hypothetical protein